MENRIVPYYVEGLVMYYRMPKELDHHVAQYLCKEMDMLVDAYQIKKLVLDFKDTEFMDSSGIGVVIGRSKTMRYRSGELYVTHLGKRINDIFLTTGLYRVVSVEEE